MTTKKKSPIKKKTGQKNPATKKKRVADPERRFFKIVILLGVILLVGIALLVRRPVPDYDERPAERTIADLIPVPESPQSSGFDVQVALELILWDIGLDLRKPRIGDRQGVRTIALDADYLTPEQLQTLTTSVEQLPGSYRVEADSSTAVVRIFDGDLLRFLLKFPTMFESHDDRPRIALIVDDLGRDMGTVRRLLSLDTALTYSILPSETYARRVAELVHGADREVLIHLPMEPRGYPDKKPGADALMVAMSDEEIRTQMDLFIAQVPYAVGGNNHMGSRFTEYRDGMRVVVDYLREADLFFVDSLTSHRSLAMETARTRQVPTAVRDVFLDNVPEVDAIVRQLHKLVRVAKRRGRAIGICHPYPETLAALEQEVALLKSNELEFVPVSALLLR